MEKEVIERCKMAVMSLETYASVKSKFLNENLDVNKLIRPTLYSGGSTLFWFDQWIGGERLKNIFIILFVMESKKS